MRKLFVGAALAAALILPSSVFAQQAGLSESEAQQATEDFVIDHPDRLADVSRRADATVDVLACGEQASARRSTFYCLFTANITDNGRGRNNDNATVAQQPGGDDNGRNRDRGRNRSREFECVGLAQVTEGFRDPNVSIVFSNCERVRNSN